MTLIDAIQMHAMMTWFGLIFVGFMCAPRRK